MVNSLKKSTPNSGGSVSTSEFLDSLYKDDFSPVPHNIPPKVTVGSFCSYDGASAFRAKVQQFKGAKRFQEVCNYYRPWYDVTKSSSVIESSWGLGENVCYRKAARREINYLKMEDRTPIADVLEFPEFHVVFSCHFGDGLLPFRNNISDVVVIFGWRMFERVRTLQEAFEFVHDELYRIGFEIVEYDIRRVDFNITTSNLPIGVFGDAYRNRKFKTLAQKFRTEGAGNEIETLYIGKSGSSVQFRAYNKTAELKSLANKFEAREKASAIFQKLGLDIVSQITRIEFELGATFFKDFGITTFSELDAGLPSIINYLFRNWLRFTEDNRETYRHKTREKVAKWWVESEKMLLTWADSFGVEQEDKERKLHEGGTGERAQQLARAFVLVAAAELKRSKAYYDVKEFALEIASLLERAELPRWGGALSKRDFMLNYEAQRAKVIREELEKHRENIRNNCDVVQEEMERRRRFLHPWEFEESTGNNENEVNGGEENA